MGLDALDCSLKWNRRDSISVFSLRTPVFLAAAITEAAGRLSL